RVGRDDLPGSARIEEQWAFRWQARAARAAHLAAKSAGLEWMDPLEAVAAVEREDRAGQALHPRATGPRPPKKRLYVLGAVVEVPGAVVSRPPLRGAHARVPGGGVLAVVAVQVRLQPPPREVQFAVVGRAGQWRQHEE